MPSGGTPIEPELTSTVFNALHAMTYDAVALAFKDASNNLNYMFLERKTGTFSTGQWFYGTDTEGGVNPRGQIPLLTYTVINNGTLDTQAQKTADSGKYYRIRIQRDQATGKQVAQAVEVT